MSRDHCLPHFLNNAQASILIVLACLFVMNCGAAIAQQEYAHIYNCGVDWVWLSPRPNLEGCGGVSRTSQGIIGYQGGGTHGISTTDNGDTWGEFIVTDTAGAPFAVNTDRLHFVDGNVGFTMTEDSSDIFKTTNGGTRWFYSAGLRTMFGDSLCTLPKGEQRGYYMLTENFGWLLTASSPTDSHLIGINLTHDGGKTWHRVRSDSGIVPSSVFFVDSLHGWVSVQTGITVRWPKIDTGLYLRTTNGGQSWDTLIFSAGYWSSHRDDDWYRLATYYDSLVGIGSSRQGRYEHTSDGGKTWMPFAGNLDSALSVYQYDQPGIVYALSSHPRYPNTIVVFGWTRDYGAHWTRDSASFQVSTWFAGREFYAVDTALAILKYEPLITTNGGKSWNPQSSLLNFNPKEIFFLNKLHGFLLGRSQDTAYKGGLAVTSDGGVHWERHKDVPADLGYYSNPSPSHIMVGNLLTLFLSTNGGRSFTESTTLPTRNGLIMSVQFVDSSYGWLFTNTRGIWKTTNGGGQWIQQQQEIKCWYANECDYYDFSYMASRNVGYLMQVYDTVNQYSRFYRTKDGGMTWDTFHMSGAIGGIYGFYFINEKHGYLLTSGTSGETTDGADTWFASSVGVGQGMNFRDSLHGWTSSDITNDGGLHWTPTTCPTYRAYWPSTTTAITIVAPSTGGIGHFGPFDTSADFVEERQFESAPSPLSLTAYPNPFADATTISFELNSAVSRSSPIQLVVYNVLGEQVLDLSSQIKSAVNTGAIHVSTSQLPTGIYVAQLRSGAGMQIQRLVVSK